jgi:hypothetical protein
VYSFPRARTSRGRRAYNSVAGLRAKLVTGPAASGRRRSPDGSARSSPPRSGHGRWEERHRVVHKTCVSWSGGITITPNSMAHMNKQQEFWTAHPLISQRPEAAPTLETRASSPASTGSTRRRSQRAPLQPGRAARRGSMNARHTLNKPLRLVATHMTTKTTSDRHRYSPFRNQFGVPCAPTRCR